MQNKDPLEDEENDRYRSSLKKLTNLLEIML
jgi:hypothetical protein